MATLVADQLLKNSIAGSDEAVQPPNRICLPRMMVQPRICSTVFFAACTPARDLPAFPDFRSSSGLPIAQGRGGYPLRQEAGTDKTMIEPIRSPAVPILRYKIWVASATITANGRVRLVLDADHLIRGCCSPYAAH